MGSFKGRHRLLGANATEVIEEAADAQIEVEPESVAISAPSASIELRIDFADVDALEIGDRSLTLVLSTKERAEISMLGKRHDECGEELATALRSFQAEHLLLEEPEGGERFSADVVYAGNAIGPCELRVFQTTAAVLPRGATPFGVPFGELNAIKFDAARYAIDLELGEGRALSLLRLGRQTDACRELLEKRSGELAKRTQAALGYLLPSSPSLELRRAAKLVRDGTPAPRKDLDAIRPGLWDELVRSAASGTLLPYVKKLEARALAGESAIGIKETHLRQDEAQEREQAPAEQRQEQSPEDAAAEAAEAAEVAQAEAEETPMTGRVAWLAFPIGDAVAFEAVTRSGRATYVFRLGARDVVRGLSEAERSAFVRERIRSLSRAMVALSFRREPIYLADKDIRSSRFARYRYALRVLEPLREARSSFLGRAIHSSAWERQLTSTLSKA